MTDLKPKPSREPIIDDSVPRWLAILCATVIIVIVVTLGYTLYADRQADIAAHENACSLQYEKYTAQWQNCIDDQ